MLIDERIVEPGDYTGPAGARAVLTHPEVDLAVLETARGGILLRGLGYESNDVSVLTNVSADHLDLQGLHTLPELVEVKSVICRVTKPSGTVVLNADDALGSEQVRALDREQAHRPAPPHGDHVARLDVAHLCAHPSRRQDVREEEHLLVGHPVLDFQRSDVRERNPRVFCLSAGEPAGEMRVPEGSRDRVAHRLLDERAVGVRVLAQ